jgi:transposase
VLQVDGYVAYDKLTASNRVGGPLVLAFCWAHFRRRFYEIAKGGNAPIATEALARIAALYEIESDIRGRSAEERRAARQLRSKPLVDNLQAWLTVQLSRVPKGSPISDAIRYGLNHWQGLGRFLDDGRIEIDSNTVERSIRGVTMTESFCSSFISVCKH